MRIIEYAKILPDGMTSASDMEIPTVLAAYDFTNVGTIVDVGGGHGRLLAAMLQNWPRSCGIFLDAESVVAGVPDDDREHLSEMIDLEMLVVAMGSERTADEYADLLRAAGFRTTRVIPTAGPTSIVESEAA
jgi:hypothetical protein